MNYQKQTHAKNWVVWRLQGSRSFWCGEFPSRTEADKAVKQLSKLFADSSYQVKFRGRYEGVDGDKGATQ
jgi:hypothetical protein